jgi:hypothetical protein
MAASVGAFYFQLKAQKAAKRDDYPEAYQILQLAIMCETGGNLLETIFGILKRRGIA